MFKFHHKDLPNHFNDMFIYNSSIHTHDTRQNDEIHVPIIRSNLLKMSVRYQGVTSWNTLSKSLVINCTLFTFKKRLKGLIIESC